MSSASPNSRTPQFTDTPPPLISLDGSVADEQLPFAHVAGVNSSRSSDDDEQELSWQELIQSGPYMWFRELAGMFTGWAFLTVGGLAAWNLGRQYYLDKIVQPAATLLVSATFPAAIIPSELLLYAITNPDLLSMAFTTLVMANKDVAGTAFKQGRDGFKDWASKKFGFDKREKKALKNAHPLSWRNIRFQILDKVSDALALAPGFAQAAFMVISVRAVSLAALKFITRAPIISTYSNIMADIYGALLFVATVLVGKEAPEMLHKWGKQFGKGTVDNARDATYALANDGIAAVGNAAHEVSNTVYEAGAAVGNTVYNVGATVGNGIYSAGAQVANTMNTFVGFVAGSAASTAPANAQYQAARRGVQEQEVTVNPGLTARLIASVTG